MMKIGLKLTNLYPPKMSPDPSTPLAPQQSTVVHGVFHDVHDHFSLRIVDRCDFYFSFTPFLHLRGQEVLQKEVLDCRANIFLRNDLVSWGIIGFVAFFAFDLAHFPATPFKVVGVPCISFLLPLKRVFPEVLFLFGCPLLLISSAVGSALPVAPGIALGTSLVDL